jgi:hypothetical protein
MKQYPEKFSLQYRLGSSKAFFIVFGISILLRLIALIPLWYKPFTSDALDYTFMGSQLAQGTHFIPYWPPGLPLFLSVFLDAGVSHAGLRIVMLIFWALCCIGLYRAAETLGIQHYAWLVLLVFSLAPASIELSVEPLTQLPVAALLLIGIGAAIRCLKNGFVGEYLLLGLSLGSMVLVRLSAAPILLFLPLLCAFKTKRLIPALVAIALGATLVAGWMVRAHRLSGVWMVNTANGQNFWNGNNPWTPQYKTWYFGSHAKPGSPELEQFPQYAKTVQFVTSLPANQQSHVFQGLALAFIRQHPIVFLFRTSNRIRCYFGFDDFTSLNLRKAGSILFLPSLILEALLYLLLITPSFFWIAAAPVKFWHSWETWTMLTATTLYAVPYWITMSHPTYHYPVLLPIALLGLFARSISKNQDNFHKTQRKRYVRGWVAVAVLMTVQLEWAYQLSRSNSL